MWITRESADWNVAAPDGSRMGVAFSPNSPPDTKASISELFSNQVRATGVTVTVDDLELTPSDRNLLPGTFGLYLGDIEISLSYSPNVLDLSVPSGLCASGNDFAQFNHWLYVLSGNLRRNFEPLFSVGGSQPSDDVNWESELTSLASSSFSTGFTTLLTPCTFVYQAGQLFFASSFRYLTWLFERLDHYRQIRRRAAAFVVAFMRFASSAANGIGVFLSERSWYLHHTAHPPDTSCEEVEGRVRMNLVACFRPLPL